MLGLRITALYGIKPHTLGFCGPREKKSARAVLSYLSGKEISEKKIRKIFERFEGAYSYYKLIAKANRIKDPFDTKVVKAYWIGNNLLDKVSARKLREMVAKEFSRPSLLSKELAEKKAKEIPKGAKPHHSFHVLRIGSVTHRIKLQGKLLDLCRISWGKITKIDSSKGQIKVKYQPLIIDKKYHLRKAREKYIIWNKNLLPQPKLGQYISFHWNQVVQVLTKKEVKNLQKYTQQTLNSLNAAS